MLHKNDKILTEIIIIWRNNFRYLLYIIKLGILTPLYGRGLQLAFSRMLAIGIYSKFINNKTRSS